MNAHRITTSEHSTYIVRIIDIFKNYGQISLSPQCGLRYFIFSFFIHFNPNF